MDDSRDARRQEPPPSSLHPVNCPICKRQLGDRGCLKSHLRNLHFKHFTKEAFDIEWEKIRRRLVPEPRKRPSNEQRRTGNVAVAAADAAASRSTRHPGGIQLGAAQNVLSNSPNTSTLPSRLPLSSGPTNPTQLTVSPVSTGFNYLSASSSSSQQQSPAIAQIPTVNFPGLSPVPQQPLDIIQALLSSQNNLDTSQLQNSIQQLFASNIPGLSNAPQQSTGIFPVLGLNQPAPIVSHQQAPWIPQPLGLNIPGPSNAPQQPLDIIQALLSNRNNFTTTQLENSIQQLFASNIPGLPNAPQQAPWIQQPLGLNTLLSTQNNLDTSQLQNSIQQLFASNIPGLPNVPQLSTGIFPVLGLNQPAPTVSHQQAPWIQQPLGLNIPGSSIAPQQNTGIAEIVRLFQPEPIFPLHQNLVPSMTQPLRVTVEDIVAGSLIDGLRLNPLLSNTGNVTTVSPGDTKVNDPTASTSQQRIDEPNVPGTSSGQREESPEPKVFKSYQPHRGPNL